MNIHFAFPYLLKAFNFQYSSVVCDTLHPSSMKELNKFAGMLHLSIRLVCLFKSYFRVLCFLQRPLTSLFTTENSKQAAQRIIYCLETGNMKLNSYSECVLKRCAHRFPKSSKEAMLNVSIILYYYSYINVGIVFIIPTIFRGIFIVSR